MTNKFNLALVPTKEYIEAFVTYARKSFHIEPAEYLLGERSIPHVTICHFEEDEKNISEIIDKVCALKTRSIQLCFSTQRSKTYPTHPVWGQWSWVSLIPDKLNELKELHLKMASIATPINAAYDEYDPHMTLFNSRDKAQCNIINQAPNVSPALSGIFEIKLGKLDDVGQITEIL